MLKPIQMCVERQWIAPVVPYVAVLVGLLLLRSAWAAILIYFISLSRRERAIWEELHALRESLSRGETSQRPQGD